MSKKKKENNVKALSNLISSHDLVGEDFEEALNLISDYHYPDVNSEGKKLFDSNGNITLTNDERKEMLEKLIKKFDEVFDILRISRNDPNSRFSPLRIARMYVNELLAGRFEPPPQITVFPNRKKVDELIISKGIEIMSLCSHHWETISGRCAIGYIPGDYVIGLSKMSRITNWFSRRGQIQEELGTQIADYIEGLIKPKALGVVIKARHYCMIARGVKGPEEESIMVTSVMRGYLLDDFNLRNEFLKLIE